jgi:hypothetical protein
VLSWQDSSRSRAYARQYIAGAVVILVPSVPLAYWALESPISPTYLGPIVR